MSHFARFTPVSLSKVSEGVEGSRIEGVEGSLFDRKALAEAAGMVDAAIHMVGIIRELPFSGQTFHRVHDQGTLAVVEALASGGVSRYAHMSALGSREGAESQYHRTKYAAECHVRDSGLAWTIFRPSVIHGHEGEFMELMRTFMVGMMPPVIPYFGNGENKVQPVSVKDVAFCMVECLRREATIGKTFELGGPRAYSWKALYEVCRRLIPGAKAWKPKVSLPVAVAKIIANTVMKTPQANTEEPVYRFLPHDVLFVSRGVSLGADGVCSILTRVLVVTFTGACCKVSGGFGWVWSKDDPRML
jgi:NADH dehydrogenase